MQTLPHQQELLTLHFNWWKLIGRRIHKWIFLTPVKSDSTSVYRTRTTYIHTVLWHRTVFSYDHKDDYNLHTYPAAYRKETDRPKNTRCQGPLLHVFWLPQRPSITLCQPFAFSCLYMPGPLSLPLLSLLSDGFLWKNKENWKILHSILASRCKCSADIIYFGNTRKKWKKSVGNFLKIPGNFGKNFELLLFDSPNFWSLVIFSRNFTRKGINQ